MKYVIDAQHAPKPRGAYSSGWRAGDFIFVAGQVPRDPATGDVMDGTMCDLTIQTLKNIESVLQADGATLKDVVKFTVILDDLANAAEMNKGFRTLMQDPLPARSTFQGGLSGVPIEIETVAYKPKE
jgi:2-iminobutanoate/2-iminopropanoate deaminase